MWLYTFILFGPWIWNYYLLEGSKEERLHHPNWPVGNMKLAYLFLYQVANYFCVFIKRNCVSLIINQSKYFLNFDTIIVYHYQSVAWFSIKLFIANHVKLEWIHSVVTANFHKKSLPKVQDNQYVISLIQHENILVIWRIPVLLIKSIFWCYQVKDSTQDHWLLLRLAKTARKITITSSHAIWLALRCGDEHWSRWQSEG